MKKTVFKIAFLFGLGIFAPMSFSSDTNDIDDITMDIVEHNNPKEITRKIKLPALQKGNKPQLTAEQKQKIQKARQQRLRKALLRRKLLRKAIIERNRQRTAK
ncbi:MAG: hypothetical protein D6B27_11640 [Gammaproteobacteria bacterium]|nr:MAG: hypothetical protein D6B27_11640 [Gammaproteobacteria bacterium]